MTCEQHNGWKLGLGDKHPFILFLLLFIAIGQVQAGLTARLDRERITAGETVRLFVESEGQISKSPDTSPLEQDFEILGVSSGSRINFINGRMDASTNWTINLSPKRSGRLIIPALELNGEQSRPLTLEVSETPIASGPAGGNPVFIETEVDRSDPYVQGMVRYTIRLLHEIKLVEGSLTEPQLDNALVRRLGKDREYSAKRDGRRYRVIERQYAIFPQTSGELELPAPVLNASVPDKTEKRRGSFQDFFGRDPFDDPFFGGSRLGDMFTSTRPVRVRGEALTLQVQPRPIQAAGSQWLPAESVALSESWQPEETELRVGDPLTRTITIHARGTTGEQLPELEPGRVDGFKVYPDRAKVTTQDLERTVQGEMTRSMAFVPVLPGQYSLPPVRLHWWDTRTNQERVAELPERTVKVLPAVASQGTLALPSTVPEPTREIKSQLPAPPAQTLLLPAEIDQAERNELATYAGIWPWLSLLFGLLWLATLGIWWRGRHQSAHLSQAMTEQQRAFEENVSKAKARFQAACHTNDPSKTRRSLLDWAAAHWPDDPPRGLDELAKRLSDPQAKQALSELDQTLYCSETQAWNGKTLAQQLSKLPKQSRTKGDKTPLPDLYA